MTMQATILTGGTWHDFAGFGRYAAGLLAQQGVGSVEHSNPEGLLQEELDACCLVVNYTCLSATLENGEAATNLMTDARAEQLRAWVARGNALLNIHCGAVACQSSPVMRRLVGGVFHFHPPAMDFTVFPLASGHEVTREIAAFQVRDEFYIETPESDAQILMVAIWEKTAYPMVWTRKEGRGAVVNIAMGHDDGVWQLPAYRQLLLQSTNWLLAPRM